MVGSVEHLESKTSFFRDPHYGLGRINGYPCGGKWLSRLREVQQLASVYHQIKETSGPKAAQTWHHKSPPGSLQAAGCTNPSQRPHQHPEVESARMDLAVGACRKSRVVVLAAEFKGGLHIKVTLRA